MEISFKISDLMEIVKEDISRLAARTYSEEGVSLYDGIKITSRDEGVMSRMLEERDARLRELLAFCMGPVAETQESLDYNLSDEEVSSSIKTPLKILFRKYLTEGLLYDWYTKHGIASSITAEDIENLETNLVCMIRQGFVKKPLQPFGPRN